MQNIIQQIHTRLVRTKQTIAIAESCTGGMLSSILTSLPGSSKYFILGAVVYSNRSKNTILKIPLIIINRHGAVSRQVAITMAKGVRKLSDTDFAIGITGIAGPTGGTIRKPVGTVYISVATRYETFCTKFQFRGNRTSIRNQAVNAALQMLKDILG